MRRIEVNLRSVGEILNRLHGERPRRPRIEVRPLRGGLESSAVLQVTAEFQDGRGRRRSSKFVAKRLEGTGIREATIYRRLVAAHAHDLAPRLLAVDRPESGSSFLYLEHVSGVSRWPWRNLRNAEELISVLARFHSSTSGRIGAVSLPPWDYEADLKKSGAAVLDLLAQCRRSEFAAWARFLPAARRLVLALPTLRRELFELSPFGSAIIHGDVHPGNALVRRRGGRDQPILIDWGRARRGSPLEDVASWLQSLAYWEPRARVRHDSLLAAYLAARGTSLSSEVRAAYWLAGASNVFAGALEYYLRRVIEKTPRGRSGQQAAADSAYDLLRIVRRADAVWI